MTTTTNKTPKKKEKRNSYRYNSYMVFRYHTKHTQCLTNVFIYSFYLFLFGHLFVDTEIIVCTEKWVILCGKFSFFFCCCCCSHWWRHFLNFHLNSSVKKREKKCAFLSRVVWSPHLKWHPSHNVWTPK